MAWCSCQRKWHIQIYVSENARNINTFFSGFRLPKGMDGSQNQKHKPPHPRTTPVTQATHVDHKNFLKKFSFQKWAREAQLAHFSMNEKSWMNYIMMKYKKQRKEFIPQDFGQTRAMTWRSNDLRAMTWGGNDMKRQWHEGNDMKGQ